MNTGILLVNLGTPDAPTPLAVFRYLGEFLSDRRVVEIPAWLWLPLLYGVILPMRSRKTAKNYQKIWTKEGSPLLVNSQKLVKSLEATGQHVALAMRYGKPSIAKVLATLQQKKIDKLIILPLFPQYSSTTTASVFDAVSKELQQWRSLPELVMINNYASHPAYIAALTENIQKHWQEQEKASHLVISFHGLPKRNITAGDPYQEQCLQTTRLLTQSLGLHEDQYTVVFQSRFGRAEWLQPYCDETLMAMPKRGIKRVDVVCPGFAVDCLETLEEIAKTNAELFYKTGGEYFRYIPALNDTEIHRRMLVTIAYSSI